MSTFDYAKTAQRVTSREVSVARLASDYAALVAYFGLTAESKSDLITDCARNVVITGAPVGASITVDSLKGRDPGDVKVRPYWKAARAVRIGLVDAMAGDKPAKDVDWMRLVKQAAENAHTKGEFSTDAIVAAVLETLNTDES